jgi:hypothetical protein
MSWAALSGRIGGKAPRERSDCTAGSRTHQCRHRANRVSTEVPSPRATAGRAAACTCSAVHGGPGGISQASRLTRHSARILTMILFWFLQLCVLMYLASLTTSSDIPHRNPTLVRASPRTHSHSHRLRHFTPPSNQHHRGLTKTRDAGRNQDECRMVSIGMRPRCGLWRDLG